jgi:hypothetical protein
MAGCEGCASSFKGMDEALIIAKQEASKRAKDQGTPVAVVLENNQYVFYDAFYAYQNKLIVKDVMSHYG